MRVETSLATATQLADYARVSIAFDVLAVFDAAAIDALSRGSLPMPMPVSVPYRKNYDSYVGCHPTQWSARFNTSAWTIVSAHIDSARVGGAALVMDDPEIQLLSGRPRTALLWDLRVAPDARRSGVGRALLRATETLARGKGMQALLVETQNVNVPACTFYRQNGFLLERANVEAYPGLADEVQLLWVKQLLAV